MICNKTSGVQEPCSKQYDGHDGVDAVALAENALDGPNGVWDRARCDRKANLDYGIHDKTMTLFLVLLFCVVCYHNNDPEGGDINTMTQHFLDLEEEAWRCFMQGPPYPDGSGSKPEGDYPDNLVGNQTCFDCYSVYKPVRKFYDHELIGKIRHI